MGYKTPLVVKEVYIPFKRSVDDKITLAEYKEKYGIDLTEFFLFSPNENRIDVIAKNTKLYFVLDEVVYPISNISFFNYGDNFTTPLVLIEFDEQSNLTSLSAIYWDYTNECFQRYEI